MKRLTKRILNELYWKKQMSSRQIGRLLKVSSNTVLNYMKKYNISRRNVGVQPKIDISVKILHKMYWGEGKSTVKLAEHFGMNRVSILYKMRKASISRRDRIKAVSEAAHNRTVHLRNPFSGNLIEQQYLLGLSEDLAIEDVNKWTIKAMLSTTRPNMIKLFETCFAKYGKIWKYPVHDGRKVYNWRLCTCLDRQSFHFLLNPEYSFNSLSKDKFYSRLAGLMDAEGSITITRVNPKYGYISRQVVIAGQNEKLIKGVAKKLETLGFMPRVYKRKDAMAPSKVGTVITKYNKALWVLMLVRKNDVSRIARELPIKNKDKKDKLVLLLNTINSTRWQEISTIVKKMRKKIDRETDNCRRAAELTYIKARSKSS